MPATNQVMLSEAVYHNRFSAEFFDPKYVFKPAATSMWLPIGRILKKCEYGISISMNVEGNGYPIFRMNEIDNCFARRPEKYAPIPKFVFEQYRLKENDILFNRTNSFEFVGRTGIVKDQTDCTFASYLIRLVPDQEIVLPEFLTVYLNTRFGVGQIKRRAMRSINQANVSGAEVKRILIPIVEIAKQQRVANTLNESFNAMGNSERLYAKAKKLLESELGLDKLNFQKPVGYTARFSELEQSRRSDSEYFNPELRYFWQNLSSRFELTAISNFASVLKFSNPTYGIDGMPIVTQKHLRTISPEGYGNELRTTDSWQRANPSAVLQYNDLLFYSVGAYLGKTNAWLNSDAAVPASFITLLRCHNENDFGFLQILLNSEYGILQSKCFQSGTSQQYIYPKDIRKFLIPEIDDRLKKELNQLVVQSVGKGLEAKKLLKQAKTRVERLIEEAVRK